MAALNQTTWIMGCGDIGRRVAGLYQNEGKAAIGWVRGVTSWALGHAQGITLHQADMDLDGVFKRAAFVNSDVFWFVPPPVQGLTDSRLRRFLLAVRDAPKRVVLISTTGVYGDSKGAWIDETAPLQPHTERAYRRLDAEKALQQWQQTYNKESVILRVPGIYALDRLPLERLKRGEPVVCADEAPWTNRIHADDLAVIATVAMAQAPSGAIYNATDGQPSTMTDYFNQVADYAGLPRPPQISLAEALRTLSAGMQSYLQESRRINNTKLLTELGITLRYPSLASALQYA